MRANLKVLIVPVALALICAAPSSPGTYSILITPTAIETQRFDRGVSSIDSTQTSTIVRLVNVPGNNKNWVTFVIGVTNKTTKPFNFGPENIIIRPTDMPPIALITYEQAIVSEQKRQSRESFWARVGAAGRVMSANNAGSTSYSGIYGGTTSGYVGSNLVTTQSNGIISGTQYNAAAAMAAQRQAQEINAAEREALQSRWASRSSTYDSMLRTTTVERGMMYGGIARFPITPEIKKLKQSLEATIEVNVGGDIHIFVGKIVKAS